MPPPIYQYCALDFARQRAVAIPADPCMAVAIKARTVQIHLAVYAHGLPMRMFLTEGARTYWAEAGMLIDRFKMSYLLANKGYDSGAAVAKAQAQYAQAAIPLSKSRNQPKTNDEARNKLRHLVENAFLYSKWWVGIAIQSLSCPLAANLVTTLSRYPKGF